LSTKHKKDIKFKKIHPPRFDHRKYSSAIQHAPSQATMPVGELAANSRNESTYIHIFTYLFLVHQPAVCTEYRHFVLSHLLKVCAHFIQWPTAVYFDIGLQVRLLSVRCVQCGVSSHPLKEQILGLAP